MTYKNARCLPELQKAAKADPSLDEDDLVREYAERDCFIKTLSAADIDVDPARCGIGGSPTKVHKVKSVVLAGQEHEKIMATQDGISNLLDELVEARVIG
jgi:electron transfer flavoprotein beta subunit